MSTYKYFSFNIKSIRPQKFKMSNDELRIGTIIV